LITGVNSWKEPGSRNNRPVNHYVARMQKRG
jgi:hypothetical protein